MSKHAKQISIRLEKVYNLFNSGMQESLAKAQLKSIYTTMKIHEGRADDLIIRTDENLLLIENIYREKVEKMMNDRK